MKKSLIICCLTLCSLLYAFGARAPKSHPRLFPSSTRDSLWNELSLTHSQTDSIRILYDLYDLNTATRSAESSRKDNLWILSQLFDVARRKGDNEVTLDALRALASVSNFEAGSVDMQLQRIAGMPESSDKREVESFLNLQNYFQTLRDSTLTEKQRREKFYTIRSQAEKDKSKKSLYDRMDQQFAMVIYGSNIIHPELLDKYLMDLRRYVETIEDKKDLLKSYYFRIAAVMYDEAQEGEKSLEADRALLNLLDKRQEAIRNSGRYFKNYDNQRFSIYRRMLTNHASMSSDSVAAVYNILNEMMRTLPQGTVSELDRLTVRAMWNMHNKQYDKALPDLRTIVNSRRFRNKPSFILSYLEAASATNSVDDMKKAQKRYIDVLLDRARDAADTEYARMRIEYEIDTLQANMTSAQNIARVAGKKTQAMTNQYLMYGLIALGIFLVTVIILQIIANRRRSVVASKLIAKNDELEKERDRLRQIKMELERANEKAREATRQKVEFLHSVSHEISEPAKVIMGFTQLITDSIPEDRRRYLAKYIDILNHNCDILQRIVRDILDSADVDDNVTNIRVTHFSLEKVCRIVAQSFIPRLNQNQQLVVESLKTIGTSPNGDEEHGVDTDARRLEQIMVNVIANAVKFCPKGTITVEPTINYDSSMMTITISDQGPGIAPGKEEAVFQRFEKLGHFADGLGLGLFVSRELAGHLGGTIYIDTNYHEGARFVIALPINIHSGQNLRK